MTMTKFYRMSGAGNTFVLHLGTLEKYFTPAELAADLHRLVIHKICTYPSVKTDGLLFLNEKDGRFHWEFFNKDGSSAEMCGNAARCAGALVLKKLKLRDKEVYFQTVAGEVRAEINPSQDISVRMPKPGKFNPRFKTEADPSHKEYFYVDSGVPHTVVPIEKISEVKGWTPLAQKLRFSPELGKAGSNVTFVEILGENHIAAVTYERGVEDYTQACGTGAVAAAIYYQYERTSEKSQTTVSMPGGDLLIDYDPKSLEVYMSGPAVVEKIIELNIEELKHEKP